MGNCEPPFGEKCLECERREECEEHNLKPMFESIHRIIDKVLSGESWVFLSRYNEDYIHVSTNLTADETLDWLQGVVRARMFEKEQATEKDVIH